MESGYSNGIEVASFTDAWIETNVPPAVVAKVMSHLLQMRGLKQTESCSYQSRYMSHLLQMRGLKLLFHLLFLIVVESHLLQMRGLKHTYSFSEGESAKSHLLQMRGLKPVSGAFVKPEGVASFTDAWIETASNPSSLSLPNNLSHLLQMRGLKPCV